MCKFTQKYRWIYTKEMHPQQHIILCKIACYTLVVYLYKHYTKISVNLHKGNASTATQNLVWNCSLLGFLKPKMAKIDVQSGYSCLRIITGTIWDSSYWSSRSHKYNNSIGNCDWVKTVNVKIPVGVVQDACWRNHLVEPCTTVHPAGPKQQNEL